jgi:hypothetical protein
MSACNIPDCENEGTIDLPGYGKICTEHQRLFERLKRGMTGDADT